MSATDALGGGMSLDDAFAAYEAEADAPTTDGGQGEAEAPQEPEHFDYSQYADKPVRLKVDGEEIEVPLQEALSGYQRQADYTRKTQELAQQRQQLEFAATLEAALRNNPAETVALLAEQYGLNQQEAEGDDDWLADPVQQEVRQVRQELAQLQQEREFEQLGRHLDGLQAKYGEEFNPREVVAAAFAQGRPISQLESVHKEIAFDRLMARQQGAADYAAQRQAQDAAVEQAKSSATGLVASGGSVGAGASAPTHATSVEDAFALAESQFGAWA